MNYLFCFNCQKQVLVSELKKQVSLKVDPKTKLSLPQTQYLYSCKKCGQESIFNPEIIKLYQK